MFGIKPYPANIRDIPKRAEAWIRTRQTRIAKSDEVTRTEL